MKFNSTLIITGILFSLFGTGCKVIVGTGPIIEREVPVEPFKGVDLDGSFNVTVEQGTDQNVKVLANENILEHVKLEVIDEVLYLGLEDGNYMNYDLEVKLVVPELNKVTLSGSGSIHLGTFVNLPLLNVTLDGSGDIDSKGPLEVLEATAIVLNGSGDIDLTLKAKDVSAMLDGSGDIRLSGTTAKLALVLDGSGDIKAFDLESTVCDATLDGSGNIEVNASRVLNATLNGSGDIDYEGEPKLDAQIDGSGTIEAE
jgi:hypothetical protein